MEALRIDPKRLLIVKFQDGENEKKLVVISCAYVQVANSTDGTPSIAIHLTWDEKAQNPDEPYEVFSDQLQRKVLPPKDVKKIKPFWQSQPQAADEDVK